VTYTIQTRDTDPSALPQVDNTITLSTALANVLASIAMEEMALAELVNAEAAKVNTAVGMNLAPAELLKVNDAVSATLDALSGIESGLADKACAVTSVLEPIPLPVTAEFIVEAAVTGQPIAAFSSYTLTDLATGVVKTVVCDACGNLEIHGLIPGHMYTLQALPAPGLKADPVVHTITVDNTGVVRLDGNEGLYLYREIDPDYVPDTRAAAADGSTDLSGLSAVDTDAAQKALEQVWEQAGLL